MTIDLVRARSNLDHSSLWRSRFRVLSLKRIIKGGLRRVLEYMSVHECASCLSARVHESGVCERHTHGVLGLEDLKQEGIIS